MNGSVKQIVIASNKGAFYFDISDCGYLVVNARTEKVLKQHPCKNGYLRVWATATDGARKSFLIHRLVAMAHLDPVDNYRLYDVNHKDGNKANNRVDNLEWVTHAENMKHARANGLWKEENGGRKTSFKERDEYILAVTGVTRTKKEIMKIFGISRPNLNRILRKKHTVSTIESAL